MEITVLDLQWLLNPPVLLFLAKGMGYSIMLALACGLISIPAGALLAAGRMSRTGLIRYPATAYIELTRSLPQMLIIFSVYFASDALVGVSFSPTAAAIIALSAFNSAVVAEILRAGLQSVERQTLEAAQSQAFSPRQVFLLIRLPLAWRRMTPALIAQFTSLLKATALTVVIGVPEFLDRAMIVTASPPYRAMPVYVLIAIMYFCVNFTISLLGRRLERAETGGMRP